MLSGSWVLGSQWELHFVLAEVTATYLVLSLHLPLPLLRAPQPSNHLVVLCLKQGLVGSHAWQLTRPSVGICPGNQNMPLPFFLILLPHNPVA